MIVNIKCTKCGYAADIGALVKTNASVMTLPECPNCGKQLIQRDLVGGIMYETSFGDSEKRQGG